MNFPRFSMILACLLLLSAACDDGDKKPGPQPSLSLSTISVGPVQYQKDPKGLAAGVTVRIVDDAGAPIPGVAVSVESDLVDHSSVLPESALTDLDGNAVFTVVGTMLGEATLLARLTDDPGDLDAPTLDATAQVTFDFSAGITPMDAAYTWDKGDFTLRLSVQDATGPIPEASGMLFADASDLELDGAPAALFFTNTSGTFTFHGTTTVSGLQAIRVNLEGVEGDKTVNVDFYGPRVSGTVSNAQAYPAGFRSARVAAMALHMTDRVTIDLGAPILAQAASESVCPCPVPADFELTLPIVPHQAMLNTDDFRQVKYNYFPIVVYDDLNDDYIWNEGEPLMAARLSAGVLHYAMPNGDNPVGQLGWKIVDTIADEPDTLDWDFFQDSLDAFIYRSPITEVHLHGASTSGAETPRVAIYAVNAAALSGYTPPLAWRVDPFEDLRANAADLLPVADVPVSGGTYDATLLAPAFTGTQADDWTVTWTTPHGETVSGVLVVPFLYDDSNQNGQLDPGEIPMGTVDAPVGTTEVIFWITEHPNYSVFRAPNELGLHPGYNRIRVCSVLTVREVQNVAGTYSFVFDVNLPAGLSGVAFQVVGEDLQLSTLPVATGTFSTHSVGQTVDVTNAQCTGCAAVAPGDQFVILSPLDLTHTELVDWTGMDFIPGSP
jgi:hypothetical protein